MIARLSGRVDEKFDDRVVVDVSGVGYLVHLSARSMARLPALGSPVTLRVYTAMREGALDLFGFLTEVEEQMFALLTSVTHVGPRGALNILSGAEPDDLARIIAMGDAARLTKLPGVGKKTAERLVVELKEKAVRLAGRAAKPSAEPLSGGHRAEVVSALEGMGFRPAQAERAALAAEEHSGPGASLDALLREALRIAR